MLLRERPQQQQEVSTVRAPGALLLERCASWPTLLLKPPSRGLRPPSPIEKDKDSMQTRRRTKTRNTLFSLPLFVLHPNSPVKRAWELLGMLLMTLNLLSYISKGLLETSFRFFQPLTDVYFVADILVRLRTGYVDTNGQVVMDPAMVASRYLRGWFVVDCVLSIPYHFLYRCIENTASLRLFVAVKEKTKRPVWSFLRSREFRREVIQKFREFWQEKRFIQNLFHLTPQKRSLPRRTLRLFLSLFRLNARIRLATWWTAAVRMVHSAAISVRTVSVFSRHAGVEASEETKEE